MKRDDEDLRDALLEDLRSSGFPLEIQISELLTHNFWKVYNQWPYTDPHDARIRTIDVAGRLFRRDEDLKSFYEVGVAIECKKSRDPWVFYTRRLDSYELAYEIFPELDSKVLEKTYEFTRKKGSSALTLGNHRASESNRGLIAVETFTRGSNKRIFDASNKATKAAYGFFRKRNDILTNRLKEIHYRGVISVYPVVVLRGRLYACSMTSSSKIDLHEEEWVIYDFPITFDSEVSSDRILIDIVTADYFEEYANSLRRELDETHFTV